MYAGWASPVPLTVPASQKTTFVLDADARRLMVGEVFYPVTTTDGRTFSFPGQFSILQAPDEAPVAYGDIVFTVDGDQFTGTAHVSTMDIDVGVPPFGVDLGTAILTGAPDTTPPRFAFVPFEPVYQPFETPEISPYVRLLEDFRFSGGEPMPPPDLLTLRSDSGDVLTLSPQFLEDATVHHDTAPTSGPAATSFVMPWVALRFADHYQLVVDGVTDFAGNAAVGLAFDTEPAPPLIPQDGFESVSTGTVLGGAQIIDGSGLPVISGGKSLYGPNSPLDEQQCFLGKAHGTGLVARLATTPGATRVTFSFREVSTLLRAQSFHSAAVAFEGGAINSHTINGSPTVTTPVSLPDGTTALVGPVETAEIDLPPGTGAEVVFAIPGFISVCDNPAPTGLIIDDLRVE
jgi:hypothetical protein